MMLAGQAVYKEYKFWKARALPIVEKVDVFLDNASAMSKDGRGMLEQIKQIVSSLTSRVTMLERQNEQLGQTLMQKDEEFKAAMSKVGELQSQNAAMQTKLKAQAQAQAQQTQKDKQ